MYYVYVLQLNNGEYYKGQTKDLDKRLKDHKLKGVKTTKNNFPIRLIHVEICSSRVEARNLEKYFKSGYGREIIQELAEMAEW